MPETTTTPPKKMKDSRVVRLRKANWAAHEQARAEAKSYDKNFQKLVANALVELKHPKLSYYGVESSKDKHLDDWLELLNVARLYGLEAWICCLWYWSKEGWEDLKKQWAELPPLNEKLSTGAVDKNRVIHNPEGETSHVVPTGKLSTELSVSYPQMLVDKNYE